MSTSIPGVPGGAPVGAPARDRFVGVGLALVVLGWLALVADFALAGAQLQFGSLVAVLSLKADIATLAEMLIVTGLGLAILGGLRDGFGALNRFFDAVLQRSATERSTTPRSAPSPMPEPPVDLGEATPPPRRGLAERGAGRVSPASPAPPAPASAPSTTPFAPPTAPGRNYQILPDGSVEVETLLGTRLFASMEEARDFIR